MHTPIDAKVEVLSDIADVQVGSTLKSLSISTDCEAVDVCHGESIVIDSHADVPISREVSHVDNSLLTPAGKISVLSDCDDGVRAIICKGLAEDIPVDEVKNHDPITCCVPYHPVFKRSGDIYFVSDCSCRSQKYSFDDCVSHTLDSTLDVMFPDVSLCLPYVDDYLLFIRCTEDMSNLVIKSESVLSNVCDFDPRKCLLNDPPMFRLIPGCNLSLDVDAIVSAHSQLVSKALGISWVMPLKQWLSWLKSFGSWINNTCLVLCYTFVFDNG